MVKVLSEIAVGIQSFCFRKFTSEQIVELLGQCDIKTLEISRVHLDLQKKENDPFAVVDIFKRSGINISAYGSNRLINDEPSLRGILGFAKRCDINILTADPDGDALFLLDRLCNEYDVKVAIHNHGKDDPRHATSSMLRKIIDSTSPNIGICLDTGWLIDAGDDPVEFANENISRIYGIHLKDFCYDEDGTRHEKLIGEGLLDLIRLMDVLKKNNYTGNITIEYEQSPDDPVPELKKCIKNLIAANSRL